jgi:hypothetical protein
MVAVSLPQSQWSGPLALLSATSTELRARPRASHQSTLAHTAGASSACNSGTGELNAASNNAAATATIETACRTWCSQAAPAWQVKTSERKPGRCAGRHREPA